MGQVLERERRAFKIFRIGPHPHQGARLGVVFARDPEFQGRDHVSRLKHQVSHFSLAHGRHLHACGQGIGHTHPNPMQAARKAIGASRALVKLATRVQTGKDELDHWSTLFGMQAKRDAPSIVLHAHRSVGVQNDFDFFAMPGQGLVGRVVEHLLDDVQGIVSTGVHPWTLLDRLESFENSNGIF